MGTSLLPMDTEHKFLAVFSTMDGKAWSSIRLTKAAVRAWHVSKGLSCTFDNVWSDRVNLFWSGLKRRASHVSSPKQPLSLENLHVFQRSRLEAGTSQVSASSVFVAALRLLALMSPTLHLKKIMLAVVSVCRRTIRAGKEWCASFLS